MLELIKSYQHRPFLGTKWSICREQFFLVQTIIITFIYLLALFIGQNLQKTLTADPELWGCPILGPKWSNCHPNFFGKFIKLTISPFYCARFQKKKTFQQIQSYEAVQFLGIKWLICPNENFFRKPLNEPCSFHSCQSTCQKSKWDINLLVKYWWLKNIEISLAGSHFWL